MPRRSCKAAGVALTPLFYYSLEGGMWCMPWHAISVVHELRGCCGRDALPGALPSGTSCKTRLVRQTCGRYPNSRHGGDTLLCASVSPASTWVHTPQPLRSNHVRRRIPMLPGNCTKLRFPPHAVAVQLIPHCADSVHGIGPIANTYIRHSHTMHSPHCHAAALQDYVLQPWQGGPHRLQECRAARRIQLAHQLLHARVRNLRRCVEGGGSGTRVILRAILALSLHCMMGGYGLGKGPDVRPSWGPHLLQGTPAAGARVQPGPELKKLQ